MSDITPGTVPQTERRWRWTTPPAIPTAVPHMQRDWRPSAGPRDKVYAIRCLIPNMVIIKIGTTGTPIEDRLAGLQTGAPFPLEVVWTKPGNCAAEHLLHWHLREYRTQGEWFDLGHAADDLVAYLEVAWVASNAARMPYGWTWLTDAEKARAKRDGIDLIRCQEDPHPLVEEPQRMLRRHPPVGEVGITDKPCTICENKPQLVGLDRCRSCLGVGW